MLPLAMGFGVPWGIRLPMMFNGLAMSLSSISVVTSSLLLKWYKKPFIANNGSMHYPLNLKNSQIFDTDKLDETLETPIPLSKRFMNNMKALFNRGRNTLQETHVYNRVEDEED